MDVRTNLVPQTNFAPGVKTVYNISGYPVLSAELRKHSEQMYITEHLIHWREVAHVFSSFPV